MPSVRRGSPKDDRLRRKLCELLQGQHLSLRRPMRRSEMRRENAHKGPASRNQRRRLHGPEPSLKGDQLIRGKLPVAQHIVNGDRTALSYRAPACRSIVCSDALEETQKFVVETALCRDCEAAR